MVTAIRHNANGTVASVTRSAVQRASLRSLTMTPRAGNYRFMVRACNAVGLSATSARSNLVPGSPPTGEVRVSAQGVVLRRGLIAEATIAFGS